MSITSGFSVSKEDQLRSKILKRGVYLLNIVSITQGPGKNDSDSITTAIKFVVKDAGEFTGVPIPYWLSEKAAGMAIGFLEAMNGGKKLPEDGFTLTPAQLLSFQGRDVKAAVKPEKSDKYGMQNKIEGFLPA